MFKAFVNHLEKKIIAISGADDDLRLFSFQGLLWGISYLYSLGVRARSLGFSLKLLPQRKLSCPVISIGNIVAGGTGKTPMAIYIAGLLKELGMKAVIVSRGYKGTNKETAAVVGDGSRLLLSADQAGDEPYMMAALKKFPVVVGKKRYQAGQKAIEFFDPDVIVLDDGFQHRQLKRDLDLVLMDYSSPLGNKRMLPAGRLREPVDDALKRADAVIFTRSRSQIGEAAADVIGMAPAIPWFKTCHVPFLAEYRYRGTGPDSFATLKDNPSTKTESLVSSSKDALPKSRDNVLDIRSLDDLKGKAALLFSALADNASFSRAMAEQGIKIVEHLEFKDHYRYKRADILRINQTAKEKGVHIILTTQKDWVKIRPDAHWKKDVAVAGIRIRFEHKDSFVSFLKERCLVS